MHGKTVCPAGYVVAQCRCMDNHRSVRQVACPPDHDHSKVPHLDFTDRTHRDNDTPPACN